MRQFLIIFTFTVACISCNKTEKREYVDKSKYPTIFYDRAKSDFVLNKVLNGITEDSYVGLSKYKGKYYLYIPCESMGYCTQIDILKDTVSINIGEGTVMRIESTVFTDNITTYRLYDEYSSATLELKRLNAKKNLFAAKIHWINNGESSYYLFVKGLKIKEYPAIVNVCTAEKFSSLELEFDKEDLSVYFK